MDETKMQKALFSIDDLIFQFSRLSGLEDRIDPEDQEKYHADCEYTRELATIILSKLGLSDMLERYKARLQRVGMYEDEMAICETFFRRIRDDLETHGHAFFTDDDVSPTLREVPDSNRSDEVELVKTVCRHIKRAAKELQHRNRPTKKAHGYIIEDEYDVQDLLQALCSAYLPYAVQEQPLEKIAAVRWSKVDIAIEELGVIIEVKYVRDASEATNILEDLSLDIQQYQAWNPLQHLIFLVYNSDILKAPHALEKHFDNQQIASANTGKTFTVSVILS